MANTRFVKAASKQEACEIAGRDWFKIKKFGDGYMFFDNKEDFSSWSAEHSGANSMTTDSINNADTVFCNSRSMLKVIDSADRDNLSPKDGKPMMIIDLGSFTFDCHIMMDTQSKDRKFKNDWSDSEGFTDLGSCTFDGTYYETYCFTRAGELCIGARFGDDGDYISAGSINMKNGLIDFYGHESKPIREAIKQILLRGIVEPNKVVRNTLVDITFHE